MSTLKPLPIGTPTLRDIVSGGYLYVDKTPLIYELIRDPKGIYFLARPRRFGKSLLISTLLEIFKGNRALFQGLWLYDSSYDWETHPIIHLDLNLYRVRSADELETSLKYYLQQTAANHEIPLPDTLYYIQFAELIKGLAKKYQKQVVVLIDEYDKPLINNLETLEEAKRIRDLLKGFYSVLKSMDASLRFILLTGVSKFSKVGVFSDLNNLYDLSMDDRFAALPGITQEEMERDFAPYIERFAQTKGMAIQELLAHVTQTMDDRRWTTPGVYRPSSIVILLYCVT